MPWYLARYHNASPVGSPIAEMAWVQVTLNHSRWPEVNSSENLLPSFSLPEQSNTSLARGWLDLGVGTYRREAAITHAGSSYAIEVICQSVSEQAGAKYEWVASSDQPLHASFLLLSGWSKALVNGAGSARDYSLYVDLMYADGTLLEGQLASFAAGVHGWQQTQVRINLDKPVTQINVYCLYRNRVGTVFFDGLSLTAHADPRAYLPRSSSLFISPLIFSQYVKGYLFVGAGPWPFENSLVALSRSIRYRKALLLFVLNCRKAIPTVRWTATR